MKKEIIGHCAVDSGQLLIVDPCYLSEWKDGEVDFEQKDKYLNSYDNACKITCAEKQAGQMLVSGIAGTGVVSSTGFGDGLYPVIAHYKDTGNGDIRIQKLEINFF